MSHRASPVDERAEIFGIYLNDYQELVKPHQKLLLDNYFIRQWVHRLGHNFSWIVICMQQACGRAETDHCTLSQSIIGTEVGIHRETVATELNNNPWRHWFIREMVSPKGTYDSQANLYQPAPRRYTIYMVTPLVPEHLAGLYSYFWQTCPNRTEKEAIMTIAQLQKLKARDVLALLEAQPVIQHFDAPLSVADVVGQVIKMDELKEASAKKLKRQLNELEEYLVGGNGHTACRQYFRTTWVPLLEPALAWLVILLRSSCYYNPETGEVRNTCEWDKKELADLLGQTLQNLRRLLKHKYARSFFQILEKKPPSRYKFYFQVEMVWEPLPPGVTLPLLPGADGTATFFDMTPQLQQHFPTSPPQLQQHFPTSPSPLPTFSDMTAPLQQHFPTHDSTIFFKVLINDESDSYYEDVQKLLMRAGVSGTGLTRLLNKRPRLQPPQVRAVILYAEARQLQAAYIYDHLNKGAAVEPLFEQLASLERDSLVLFNQALTELKDSFSPLETHIPDQLRDLFVRTAVEFARLEDHEVRLRLSPPPVSTVEVEPSDSSLVAGELEVLWGKILEQLRLQMPKATYDTWIKETYLLARENDCFTVAVSGEYAKEWLENRLMETIKRTIAHLLGEAMDRISLEFVLKE